MRPAFGHCPSKGKAIQASRHLDVGEEQHDVLVMRLHQRKGRIAMIGIQNSETGIRQNIHRIHTDEEVIVDNQGIRGVFDVLVHVETRQSCPLGSQS